MPGRGGNSNYWTGRADRYQPADFAGSPYADPACPWPLSYDELKPYYVEAERLLNVTAAPFSDQMPPRDVSVPAPKKNDIAGLQALFANQGITIDSSPTAKPRKAFRFFRLPAEQHARLTAHPNIELVSGITVTRIQHEQSSSSRVTGLQCQLPDGREVNASARAYLLGCGGIQTPRLLLLSKSCAISPRTRQRFGLGRPRFQRTRGHQHLRPLSAQPTHPLPPAPGGPVASVLYRFL